MLEACFMLFAKFYLSELLLLVAVVTAYYAQCGIHGVEDCSHRLVVGDALGVVAPHDADELVRQVDGFLLYDLVVAYDAEHHLVCDDGELAYLIVGEEFVLYLDDALASEFLRTEIEADGDLRRQLVELEERCHLESLVGGDVVDDRAVLYRGYETFFLVHGIWTDTFQLVN